MLRAAVLVVALALAASSTAAAASPSALFAKRLKTSMQSYYDKAIPGLKITTVTCSIPAAGSTGRCRAHFTITAKRAKGVFVIGLTINRSTGNVRTKTLSATCLDSKTGAKLKC